MIDLPEITPDAVAAHYDDLDAFYRRLWGEHLHHGLWSTGREHPEDAVRQLIYLVADRAQATNTRVCDIGCGYGGTARVLAREYGSEVTGVTVSRRQIEHAQSQPTGRGENLSFHLQNWLENRFSDSSFDSVLAIESLAHMPDKLAFFQQARRVLRPGGRLVVCAWITAENPRPWHRRRLLLPICREGRLPSLGSRSEYERLIDESGLELVEYEDLSQRVKRTWVLCVRRVISHVIRRPSEIGFLLDRRQPNRIFFWTVFRIWLAYRVGCMRYGLFVIQKS